jgi:hypothetical protein
MSKKRLLNAKSSATSNQHAAIRYGAVVDRKLRAGRARRPQERSDLRLSEIAPEGTVVRHRRQEKKGAEEFNLRGRSERDHHRAPTGLSDPRHLTQSAGQVMNTKNSALAPG